MSARGEREGRTLSATLPLAALSYPISAWLLLAAAGLVRVAALSSPAGRRLALELGLMSGAVGVWLLPFGLGALLRGLPLTPERRERTLDVLADAWATSFLLLASAAAAVWSLRASFASGAGDLAGTALVALFFLAGVGSRLYVAAGLVAERRRFGKTSFAPSVIECAPGGEAEAMLTLEKPAASVEARLELYLGDDAPKQTLPAQVADGEPSPDGWRYRVSVRVPAQPVPAPDDGGWVLTVKAHGRGGGVFEDGASIELKP